MEEAREWYRPFKPLVLGSNPSALILMNFPHRGRLSPTQSHF
jgi:hypothetical protein